MRIAILGAGGVGGYDGAVLSRAGNEVQLLARGKHLEAIRAGGLRVTEADGSSWVARVGATDDPIALRGSELGLVTVKSYDLDAIGPVAAESRPARGHRRSAAQRRRGSGAARAPRRSTAVASRRAHRHQRGTDGSRPGVSQEHVQPGGGRRARRRGASARATEIAALFTAAGAEARASAEMSLELWRKFVFITTMGSCCGLARTSIGPVRDALLGQVLLERATAESVGVGRAMGIGFASDEVTASWSRCARWPRR